MFSAIDVSEYGLMYLFSAIDVSRIRSKKTTTEQSASINLGLQSAAGEIENKSAPFYFLFYSEKIRK